MVESSCGQKVRLVFPLTYMNDSGRVVPKVVSPSDSVLVICDQMDLPCGRMRPFPRGSHVCTWESADRRRV